MKHSDPQFKFRIPPGLKVQLEEAAAPAGRTMTAEIIKRLEDSFKPIKEVEDTAGDLLREMDMLDAIITKRKIDLQELEKSRETIKTKKDATVFGIRYGYIRGTIDGMTEKRDKILDRIIQEYEKDSQKHDNSSEKPSL